LRPPDPSPEGAGACARKIFDVAVLTRSARIEIAKAGFDPVYGARPLKRAIQTSIENLLAKRILEGEFGARDTVKIAAKGGTIRFGKGG
jgi:ATP-dependent Clp protease ATP-binding subunit ClpB